jgi:xylulokinase
VYLGIDLGTSGVKAVLIGEDQTLIGQASVSLDVSRPRPNFSEQDPADWWRATGGAIAALKAAKPKELAAVKGIGLSGQMHGATLLGCADDVLRPAILWNDGRSGAECAELEAKEPRTRRITGNLAMPGFTAPKLLWVAKHEPDLFPKVAKVLLPKDYVRLLMSGEYISDMSDASGTLWLDVASRDWSDAMLGATGLSRGHMPGLVEGSEPGGELRADIAAEWSIDGRPIIAGGAGDNAAGAAGVGTVAPGRAFISLGTSGVYFVANPAFSPNPDQAVHAFCHCLPATWHQMSVILSAASCLTWAAAVTGAGDEGALLAEIEAAGADSAAAGDGVIFLPYLSGERTPHNNPDARGAFFGLSHATDRAALGRAVLEGVAFAIKDGEDALLAAGAGIDEVSVIGGGARSALWGRILASVLDRPLNYHSGGEIGPAFGAARLAILAVTGADALSVCTAPPIERVIEPDTGLAASYPARHARFKRLYGALAPEFKPASIADAAGT